MWAIEFYEVHSIWRLHRMNISAPNAKFMFGTLQSNERKKEEEHFFIAFFLIVREQII